MFLSLFTPLSFKHINIYYVISRQNIDRLIGKFSHLHINSTPH
jgi:hypothetical protein